VPVFSFVFRWLAFVGSWPDDWLAFFHFVIAFVLSVIPIMPKYIAFLIIPI
jgi:CBS domain containing-hemolysin-like protein